MILYDKTDVYSVMICFDHIFFKRHDFVHVKPEQPGWDVMVYDLDIFENTLRKDIELWCNDTLTSQYEITNSWIRFTSKNDAMIFKLTWC